MIVPDALPRGIGYWGAGDPPRSLPRPHALVCRGWQAENRDRIAAYLRAGPVAGAWAGLAVCRFEDCGELLGSGDLTDGQWVWPQRLEHYIQVHEVCLPDEFVETIRSQRWEVPADIDGNRIGLRLDWANKPFGDLSYWLSWSAAFLVRAEPPDAGERG